MLVLLPPSEGKADGGDGPPLDLAALSFPALTPVRTKLVSRLEGLARKRPEVLRVALGLSQKQADEVARDALLRSAPTLPAVSRYTGIVYDNLSYATLRGPAKRRADSSLVVASALFGLLRPTDLIPAYRLSGATTLPGLGGLAPVWRTALECELSAVRGLVVDLRSGAYAALARVPGSVEVRVLREAAGKRTVVSHDNKWTKGRLARALCEHGARTVADVADVGRSVSDAVEVSEGRFGPRVDLLLHGLASARLGSGDLAPVTRGCGDAGPPPARRRPPPQEHPARPLVSRPGSGCAGR